MASGSIVAQPQRVPIGTVTLKDQPYPVFITKEWLRLIGVELVAAGNQALGGSGITALTGDVTATGPGSAVATIAPDAVTYAKMQNVSAASKLLGRGSASGAGDVEEITLGTNLTLTGTTLSASGSGSGGGHVVNGRLTLTTGTPVPTVDVPSFASVYWTPYLGNTITLWDGAAWTQVTFAEISTSIATFTINACYDFFGYLSAGALAIETLAWKNSTVTITIASPGIVSWTAHGLNNGDTVVFTTTGALPTGLSANTRYYVVNRTANDFQVAILLQGTAINTSGSQSGTHTAWQSRLRGTDISLQDGRYCKVGDKTRLYLGTIFMDTAGTTADTTGGTSSQVPGKRYVWNYYNRIRRNVLEIDTTATWVYGTAAWRQANGATGNRVDMVVGVNEDMVDAQLLAHAESVSASVGNVGFGLDIATVPTLFSTGGYSATAGSADLAFTAYFKGQVGIGYHSLYWIEYAGFSLFIGNAARRQSGITASVTC